MHQKCGEQCWWIEDKILCLLKQPSLLGCPIEFIQDVLSKTCQLPDTEGYFIPFHQHFHQCWEPFCLNRWKYPNTQKESSVPSIWLELSQVQVDWLYAVSGRQSQGQQRIGCLLGTLLIMWVLQQVELQICCKIVKLAGLISESTWRAGQSACCLSCFFQWPMMSSSICPLSKLRKLEWRKYSETTGSVMLIFCHFVIVWRVTWNERICGNNLIQFHTLLELLSQCDY